MNQAFVALYNSSSDNVLLYPVKFPSPSADTKTMPLAKTAVRHNNNAISNPTDTTIVRFKLFPLILVPS